MWSHLMCHSLLLADTWSLWSRLAIITCSWQAHGQCLPSLHAAVKIHDHRWPSLHAAAKLLLLAIASSKQIVHGQVPLPALQAADMVMVIAVSHLYMQLAVTWSLLVPVMTCSLKVYNQYIGHLNMQMKRLGHSNWPILYAAEGTDHFTWQSSLQLTGKWSMILAVITCSWQVHDHCTWPSLLQKTCIWSVHLVITTVS